MIRLVITGGQTGADIAAWRAAKAAGIPTFGYMPMGFMAEDGLHPEYARAYHAVALESNDYRDRTRRNVDAADAVLLFARRLGSPGSRLTLRLAGEAGKPVLVRDFRAIDDVSEVVDFIETRRSLMVGGNRESVAPGICDMVWRYLSKVFEVCRMRERLSGLGAGLSAMSAEKAAYYFGDPI